jgi:hypothetical protein
MADKFVKLVTGVLVETEADHGLLAGLGDDDHTQYLHLTRVGGQNISGGYLGIGASSPSYKLHVKGTTDSDARIGIEATAVDGNVYLSLKNDARTFLFGVAGWAGDSFIIFDETAGALRMTISAIGEVGFYANVYMPNNVGLVFAKSASGNPGLIYTDVSDYMILRGAANGILIVNNAHDAFNAKFLDSGIFAAARDKFQVDADGNLSKIKNLGSYAWPAAHASGYLKNNGSGTLSWDALADPAGEGHILLAFFNYNAADAGSWNPQFESSCFLGGNIYNSTHNDLDQISWKAFLAAGTYTLRVVYGKAGNQGIADFYIDDVEVGSVDMYAASASLNNIYTVTGITVSTSGLKTIKAKVEGKNISSGDHYIKITSITFWRTA